MLTFPPLGTQFQKNFQKFTKKSKIRKTETEETEKVKTEKSKPEIQYADSKTYQEKFSVSKHVTS